jgi:hypothetical protein
VGACWCAGLPGRVWFLQFGDPFVVVVGAFEVEFAAVSSGAVAVVVYPSASVRLGFRHHLPSSAAEHNKDSS